MGTRKLDPRRIERLEAFARSLKIEDAKKRFAESLAKMSEEEVASLRFALEQIDKVIEEDAWKGEELIKSGLAATEGLEERARLGWRRFCETGCHAAALDFDEATEDQGCPPDLPDPKGSGEDLWEYVNPGKKRRDGVRFHIRRLATEQEK